MKVISWPLVPSLSLTLELLCVNISVHVEMLKLRKHTLFGLCRQRRIESDCLKFCRAVAASFNQLSRRP